MTVYRLTKDLIFPDPTLADPEGLLAVGGDLSSERLLLAYSMGIFPWYSHGQPILWWSPDPRLILVPTGIHTSKSLNRVLRSNKYEYRFDTDFLGVICNCSQVERNGQDGTWITNEMIEAYYHLHRLGYAHSVETYSENRLVGGLYGISLGHAFFGESMFSHKPDASKAALVNLTQRLVDWKFDFIDCQVRTNHLVSMGAIDVGRDDFLEKLYYALQYETRKGSWTSFAS
ncbi:leucyl/phenylalanyl-tRNA--protein transferase [bacterium]|nr:leucyl/phenylalanyl-tRNA--protein transferase [bacterium]